MDLGKSLLQAVDALRIASCSLASSCSSKGSRFDRIVPLNNCVSCGIIAMRERRSSSPIFAMSTPSTTIEPACSSTILNSACMMDCLPVQRASRQHSCDLTLFPAPVRPTIPIFCPPAMFAELQITFSRLTNVHTLPPLTFASALAVSQVDKP